MAEKTPLEPIEPEPTAAPVTAETVPVDPAPTEPVATVAAAPGPQPGAQAWPTPPPPTKSSSSTVAVPKWLLLVAGAVVIALIGFGVGYAAGDDGGDGRDVRAFGPSPGFAPSFPNNGGNGSNGGGNNGGSNGQPTIPSPSPSEDSAFLGVATTAATDPAGVRIERVIEGSPAADAGLKVDDVITKVDDEAVRNPEALGAEITDHDGGDEVTITYVRDGKTNTARVELVDRSSVDIPSPTTPSQPRL
jgi:membrane-associated protease RseP (regulator of RpoE activity)